MSLKKWLDKNTESLKQKRVAITGSTGGIGNELVRLLAFCGADLILLDRNKNKSENLKNELLCLYPSLSIKCFTVDLSVIKSVKEVSEKLKEEKIDIFIHNAGAYKIPRHKTKLGVDNIFQINFVSPYYIIKELLPFLSKVVVVGSIAHRYSVSDTKDIDFSMKNACSFVYGNAKRYLMFSLFELFAHIRDVKLSVCHPGITFTNITAHYPKIIFSVIKYPMKVIFMKPKIASLSVLKGVFDNTEYFEWIGPRYFDIWGMPSKKKLKVFSDESKSIFNIAEELYSTMKNNNFESDMS